MDEVDLDALGAEPVGEALHHPLGLVVVEEGAVDEVDAEDAERLGLQRVVVVEHAHVHDHVAGLGARVQLQADADPAVAFVLLLEAARGDGGGVGEEGGVLRPQVGQPCDHLGELLVQHLQQAGAADVAVDMAVDVVADRHVVGRHGLGDGAGGGADLEEAAGDFLAGADLDDRAVLVLVEVDREGLLVGGQRGVAGAHGVSSERSGSGCVADYLSLKPSACRASTRRSRPDRLSGPAMRLAECTAQVPRTFIFCSS